MNRNLRDEQLKVELALPNGATSSVSDGIDLGLSANSDFVAGADLLLTAPTLSEADLADAATLTYDVQHADAADFGDAETLFDNVLVQTGDAGSGGDGAAAATARMTLPTTVKRYLRLRATNSGAGDISDKSATLELLF